MTGLRINSTTSCLLRLSNLDAKIHPSAVLKTQKQAADQCKPSLPAGEKAPQAAWRGPVCAADAACSARLCAL